MLDLLVLNIFDHNWFLILREDKTHRLSVHYDSDSCQKWRHDGEGVSYTGSSLYHADSSWTDWLNVKQAFSVCDLLVADASSVLPSFIHLKGSGLASS